MSEDNRDLIDLCRLNLMEEHIRDSCHPERDLTLEMIDRKRREIAAGIARPDCTSAISGAITGKPLDLQSPDASGETCEEATDAD